MSDEGIECTKHQFKLTLKRNNDNEAFVRISKLAWGALLLEMEPIMQQDDKFAIFFENGKLKNSAINVIAGDLLGVQNVGNSGMYKLYHNKTLDYWNLESPWTRSWVFPYHPTSNFTAMDTLTIAPGDSSKKRKSIAIDEDEGGKAKKRASASLGVLEYESATGGSSRSSMGSNSLQKSSLQQSKARNLVSTPTKNANEDLDGLVNELDMADIGNSPSSLERFSSDQLAIDLSKMLKNVITDPSTTNAKIEGLCRMIEEFDYAKILPSCLELVQSESTIEGVASRFHSIKWNSRQIINQIILLAIFNNLRWGRQTAKKPGDLIKMHMPKDGLRVNVMMNNVSRLLIHAGHPAVFIALEIMFRQLPTKTYEVLARTGGYIYVLSYWIHAGELPSKFVASTPEQMQKLEKMHSKAFLPLLESSYKAWKEKLSPNVRRTLERFLTPERAIMTIAMRDHRKGYEELLNNTLVESEHKVSYEQGIVPLTPVCGKSVSSPAKSSRAIVKVIALSSSSSSSRASSSQSKLA